MCTALYAEACGPTRASSRRPCRGVLCRANQIAELTSTNTEEENQTLALAYLNKNEKLLLLGPCLEWLEYIHD